MPSLATPTEGIEPVAPPASLLTVARPLPMSIDQWRGGVAAEPGECERAYSWAICNPGEEDPDTVGTQKSLARDVPPSTFRPWPGYLPEGCDDYAAWEAADYSDRAETALGAYTAYLISAELETGQFTSNPALRTAASVVDSGSANAPHVAFSKLLDARISQGIAGYHMIHVPQHTLPLLVEKDLVIPTGAGRLQTPGGVAVSIGPGYTGADDGAGNPGPIVADSAYIYITGMVEWAAGPISQVVTTPSDFVRTNYHREWAERMLIYRFSDCYVYAIAMSTTGA